MASRVGVGTFAVGVDGEVFTEVGEEFTMVDDAEETPVETAVVPAVDTPVFVGVEAAEEPEESVFKTEEAPEEIVFKTVEETPEDADEAEACVAVESVEEITVEAEVGEASDIVGVTTEVGVALVGVEGALNTGHAPELAQKAAQLIRMLPRISPPG